MPVFRYRFVKPATGKLNTGRKRAFDEGHLREMLTADGILGVRDIEAEPVEPATDRQIAYMRDLGIPVFDGLNIREASDLISNKQARRVPGEEYERGLARHYRVEVTRFASKSAIYEDIAAALHGRQDWRALVGWYVFRVYRNCADRTAAGFIATPDHASLARVADSVFGDEKCLKSIQREMQVADGWRWFGKYRAADGNEYQGASTKTVSYKAVHAGLLAAGLIPVAKPAVWRENPPPRAYMPPEDDPPPARRSWWQRLTGR